MNATDLRALGWSAHFEEAFAPYAAEGLVPARVAVQHRGGLVLLAAAGELEAEAARRLVRERELPTVGDWVAAELRDGESALVHAILPRRTKFSRKETMERVGEQVVAANVDTVFLVTGLDRDFNLRRIERYLTAAWESGADPVVVLTKADVADDVAARVAEVEAVAFGVPVHALSNLTGEGLDALDAYLAPGRTVGLLGSSGVGKSTLVNRLLGEERQATGAVRDDGKGRHTTTHRELVRLPGGALLVDTPGMRELQLWVDEEALEQTFADIAELAAACRFADCSHEHEPGCAVLAALAAGTLPRERYESYLKLRRELEALERRKDARLRSEQRKEWRRFSRSMRRVKY